MSIQEMGLTLAHPDRKKTGRCPYTQGGKVDNSKGEMPFLDHLEELRWRILWSLLALTVCSAVASDGA